MLSRYFYAVIANVINPVMKHLIQGLYLLVVFCYRRSLDMVLLPTCLMFFFLLTIFMDSLRLTSPVRMVYVLLIILQEFNFGVSQNAE